MIPALIVFICFCCALFVWLWERIEGEGLNTMIEDSFPVEFMQWAAKQCRCCPECCDHPCAGVMAGGLCDAMSCSCDDWLSEDWEDDE